MKAVAGRSANEHIAEPVSKPCNGHEDTSGADSSVEVVEPIKARGDGVERLRSEPESALVNEFGPKAREGRHRDARTSSAASCCSADRGLVKNASP